MDKKKIIFVDDDDKILNGLKRMLHDSEDKWELNFVNSADAAIELIGSTQFDVVVSDVKMPEKTGIDLLRELKSNEETKALPVIMLTGLNEADLKRKALELGAIDLLNKPVQFEDLHARINSVLKVKEFQDELLEKNSLLEEQLYQKQKMEVIGNLASGAFHDINNILAIIGGYSQLIKVNPNLVEKSMAQINESCKLASKLIQQVLEFAKSKKEMKSLLDIGILIEDGTELLRHCIPKRIELKLEKPDNLVKLQLNQTQIFQLLMNLCLNAANAITDKGEIRVKLSETFLDNNHAASTSGEEIPVGRYVTLSVSDSGYGMGNKTLNGMFTPFFSKKWGEGGTGLGMVVVQRIIGNHNGKINVESGSDAGTRITVYFPVEASLN